MRCYSFIWLLIIFLTFSCKSPFYEVKYNNSISTVIKKGKNESVIFSKEADCFLCNLGVGRFTPTIQEVNGAEEILRKRIRAANNPMYNQGNGCPIIHNNLKNYRRQYYGFIDKEGNKVLFVNFIWSRYSISDRLKGYFKDESDDWKTQRVIVLDGCSHYWSIEVNITKNNLQNIRVNGVA